MGHRFRATGATEYGSTILKAMLGLVRFNNDTAISLTFCDYLPSDAFTKSIIKLKVASIVTDVFPSLVSPFLLFSAFRLKVS